jgi:TRAP-type mannitol/chloroaromatic compound transport system permease small subunit
MKSYIFLATYSLPKVAKIKIFLFKKKYKKRTDIIDMFFSSSFFFFSFQYCIRYTEKGPVYVVEIRRSRERASVSGEIRQDLEKGPVYPVRSTPDLRPTRRRDPARIPTPPIDENTHFKNTHLAENE